MSKIEEDKLKAAKKRSVMEPIILKALKTRSKVINKFNKSEGSKCDLVAMRLHNAAQKAIKDYKDYLQNKFESLKETVNSLPETEATDNIVGKTQTARTNYYSNKNQLRGIEGIMSCYEVYHSQSLTRLFEELSHFRSSYDDFPMLRMQRT